MASAFLMPAISFTPKEGRQNEGGSFFGMTSWIYLFGGQRIHLYTTLNAYLNSSLWTAKTLLVPPLSFPIFIQWRQISCHCSRSLSSLVANSSSMRVLASCNSYVQKGGRPKSLANRVGCMKRNCSIEQDTGVYQASCNKRNRIRNYASWGRLSYQHGGPPVNRRNLGADQDMCEKVLRFHSVMLTTVPSEQYLARLEAVLDTIASLWWALHPKAKIDTRFSVPYSSWVRWNCLTPA